VKYFVLLLAMLCTIFNPAYAQEAAGDSADKPKYPITFETFSEEDLYEKFMILDGDFRIKKVESNTLLELSPTPLNTYGLLFGSTQMDNIVVSVRIRSESVKRRVPRFGIGVNGIRGYKLRGNPSRRVLELVQGEEVKKRSKYKWISGQWTWLRLQIRRVQDGRWMVEGKVWPDGQKEPTSWMISQVETEKPIPGRPSIWGTPYSSRPIQFDDLSIARILD